MQNVIWCVDRSPGEQLTQSLEALLAELGVLVAPRTESGPWGALSQERAVGVVLAGGPAETLVNAVSQICSKTKLPVLVLTQAPTDKRHQLLRAGALHALKPAWGIDSSAQRFALKLRHAVQTMLAAGPLPATQAPSVKIIAIASSTGGPKALRTVLAGAPFQVPVVVAQHVAQGFDERLCATLRQSGIPAQLARDGQSLEPGLVLFAPAHCDLTVSGARCSLRSWAEGAVVTSADRLLESVAKSFGHQATGMVLTGMGSDGAQGLLSMAQAGAFTFTQRGDTCVVDGMPASARALGASQSEWSPQEIAEFLGKQRAA